MENIQEKARRLIEVLREKGMTVATAESCTAGLISAHIADIPGSSDVLLGGVVSYANEVKTKVLGVPAEVIEKFGAVSEPCARAMADGVRCLTGASVSVSVTGIAGPGGGTDEKPVGTVCFGVSDVSGTETFTEHFDKTADRQTIRELTVIEAMTKVLEKV